MALLTIPVSATPLQTFSTVLSGHDVDVTLQSLEGALYIDVVCDDVPVCAGRVCQDRQLLTPRAAQLGFSGLALYFVDLRGTTSPTWEELGSRYLLLSAVVSA